MKTISDPLILSIETATLGGSVCIARGVEVLTSASGDPTLSHSNSLLSDIQTCLSRAGVSAPDIELFAAASGPGSFTGLRIGLATVKGLATTLDRPCLGIPTLHAVAHAAGPSDATVALLPAGRGEVFVQLLKVSESEVTELDEAAHLAPDRAISRYEEFRALKWAGAGAQAYQTQIETQAVVLGHTLATDVTHDGDVALPAWILAPAQHNLANNVAVLAYHKFQRGHLEVAESLTAIYVRPSDAELKCK
jgi:tRNA threonylcarbamoyladenosine biosynthesis protein TsaB